MSTVTLLPAQLNIIPFKTNEEWLEQRGKGVGGSDVPIIMGLSKFKTAHELYNEKTGAKTADSSNQALKRGKRLEPIVIENFVDENPGYRVDKVDGLLVHPEKDFLRGNLDGLIITPNNEIGVFEAKTTDPRYWYFWQDGVPAMYQCQVQFYLFLTGLQFSTVAVEIGYTNRVSYEVQRDDEAIEIIMETVADFWHYVQNKEPLPASYAATAEELNKYYGSYKQKSVKELPAMLENTLQEYYLTTQKLQELTELNKDLEIIIKKELGDYEIGKCGNAQVIWTHQKRKFNEEKFKAENPKIVQEYTFKTKDSKTLDLKRLQSENPGLIAKYLIVKPGTDFFDAAKARKANKTLEDKYMESMVRSKFEVTIK